MMFIIAILIMAGATASILACMTITHIERAEKAIRRGCEE